MSGPLNDIAFGDDRKDELGGTEPDNRVEQNLLLSLYAHIQKNRKIRDEDITTLKDVINSDQYRDMFPPYMGSKIYRGISIDDQWLKNNFGISIDKLEKKGHINVKGTYKPRLEYSSWSTDIKPASIRASESENSIHKSAIILVANPNLCDATIDLESWYKLIDSSFSEESEVLVFGDIPVHELYAVH